MMVPLKHNGHLFYKKVHINQLLVEVVTYQLMLLLSHQIIIWRLIVKQPKIVHPNWKVLYGIILQRSKLEKKIRLNIIMAQSCFVDHQMMGRHIFPKKKFLKPSDKWQIFATPKTMQGKQELDTKIYDAENAKSLHMQLCCMNIHF